MEPTGNFLVQPQRGMASSDKQCRLCREAGGICTPGYRNTHVREDPACRLHGIKENMTTSIRPRQKGGSSHSGGGAASPDNVQPTAAKLSLTHMVRFDTKTGLGLLFHPGPLDKWIGRRVTWGPETESWKDEARGRPPEGGGRVLGSV